jgi:hypothetical protein
LIAGLAFAAARDSSLKPEECETFHAVGEDDAGISQVSLLQVGLKQLAGGGARMTAGTPAAKHGHGARAPANYVGRVTMDGVNLASRPPVQLPNGSIPALLSAASASAREPRKATALCQLLISAIAPGEGISIGHPEVQDLIVQSGAANLILEAMRAHPLDNELNWQCSNTLEYTAQWNVAAARMLGDAGFMQVVEAFVRRNSDNATIRGLMGPLGGLMDFDQENQALFLSTGGIDLIFDLVKKYPSEPFLGSFECLLSTQGLEANKIRMAELGYFDITAKAMLDYPNSIARGEGLWVLVSQFAPFRPEWRNTMHDNGVVTQVINMFQDEPDAYDEGWSHDPLGPGPPGILRCMTACVRLLDILARNNATHRDNILNAGATNAIQAMLLRVGDPAGSEPFGAIFDLLGEVCGTLTTLANSTQAGFDSVTDSGVLDTAANLMGGRNSTTDGWIRCNTLLLLAGHPVPPS